MSLFCIGRVIMKSISKKSNSILIKSIVVLLAVFLVIPGIAKTVTAAGNTVAEVGTELSKTDVIPLTLNRSKIQTEIPAYDGTVSDIVPGDDTGIDMVLNKTYTASYPAALDYFGIPLTVNIEVTLVDTGLMPETGSFCKIYTAKNFVNVGWRKGYDVKVQWKISIVDPATGKPYNAPFYVGFNDPDESNYGFSNATKRELLYVNDEEELAAKSYIVKENGLFRIDENGNELNPQTMLDSPGTFFENALFITSMLKEENASFTFTTTTFAGGAISVPYIYSVKYKVKYELNDDKTAPATNPTENPDEYYTSGKDIVIEDPTRPGYVFTGWEDKDGDPQDTIPAWERGDKTFVATWKKIEYKLEYDPNEDYAGGKDSVDGEMDDQTVTIGDNTLNDNEYSATGYKFTGWNTKPDGTGDAYKDPDTYTVTAEDIKDKEDGDTVAILYAQWEPIEYTIKYDPNGGEGEMPDDDHRKYDTDYELSTHLYTREGYDWVGWNTKPDRDGQEYVENEGYRNLTAEDGGVVTMYAQWKPWEYYLDYDANGGVGEMPMQNFTYEDETMMSKKNQFTREGYKFTGFLYTFNGNSKIITDPAEFREMLLELGPYSKITLIAQWEKIQEQVAPIPITGVE